MHEWAQDVEHRIEGNDEIIQIPNLFLSGKAAKTKFGSSLHSDPRQAIFGRADIEPTFQVQPSLFKIHLKLLLNRGKLWSIFLDESSIKGIQILKYKFRFSIYYNESN